MHGSDARMRVSSVMRPGIVQRHVEVGADEDALAGDAPLRDEVLEAEDVHGSFSVGEAAASDARAAAYQPRSSFSGSSTAMPVRIVPRMPRRQKK